MSKDTKKDAGLNPQNSVSSEVVKTSVTVSSSTNAKVGSKASPGLHWADDMSFLDSEKSEKSVQNEKTKKELLEIFQVLNHENSSIRQGGLKALIMFSVQQTKLSKTDVRTVCREQTPATPVLRSEGPKKKQQTGKSTGVEKKEPKLSNKYLKQREAELRALFPDFKTSGKASEYALMKTVLVTIHKEGNTVEGTLTKSLQDLKNMPLKRVVQ